MKKLLLSVICVVASSFAWAEGDALNLTMKDGTIHSFLLSEEPTVTMADDYLVITLSDNSTASYDLYQVSKYTFGSSTGISKVLSSKDISLSGDNIIFQGITSGKVDVSSLSGAKVNASVSESGGNTVVSLSSLPAGVYVVKVNNAVIKISKK